MTKKSKIFQVLAGIVSALAVWALTFLFLGEVWAEILPEFNFPKSGMLVKCIFYIIYLAYCVAIAVYSKRKDKTFFFGAAMIIIALPIIVFAVSMLNQLLGFIVWDAVNSGLYYIGLPAAAAFYCFTVPDTNFILLCISLAIVVLSPIASLIVYKKLKK